MIHPPFRTSLLGSFSRSQISAATATAVDYGVLFGLAELLGVWYVFATAAGAAAGALTNFIMNRHWSFDAAHAHLGKQAWKYTAVSLGSLLLNTGGVYLMTESTHVHYGISVVVISLLVGIGFNFPLHRYYVFRGN